MRRLRIIAWVSAALLLTACGSDTLTGSTSSTGTTSSVPVSTIAVTSSTASIAADGSTSATISATATDANNNFVSGATVAFSSSAGGLAVTQATTDANGVATATLPAGSAAAGTAITVTAASGGVSAKVTVTVGNTQQTISVITSVPQIPSDSSKQATITALVRNAQNQFVAGVPVTFTSTSGGLTVTQATTGTNGAAIATLSAAGDPTNRTITVTATAGSTTATIPVAVIGTKLSVTGPTNLVQNSQGTYTVALTDAGGTDTITATALGLIATQSVVISTQSFAFTAPATNALVNIGTPATLTVVWTAAGVPQSGQTVTFSATRGTLSATSASIGASGSASVTISSTTAGPAVVSASGSGVSAQVVINFVATVPSAIAVQASPATIVTQGQSTLTATVRDANNNLVQGQVVDFTITHDSTGGSLSVASATTNAQGQASTVYTASTTTSASNGIVVSASVQATAVTGSTSLTVGGSTVFLSLGTGNTIAAFSATQYSLPYSVQAVDAAGNGVNNVPITFTVTSLGYVKGERVWNGTLWITNSNTLASDQYVYIQANVDGCVSEDVNGNGILDPGEDYNTNGKLDPGLVVSTDVGSATTASGGSAAVNLIYPKDHAYYVAVRLTATATVSGTQSSTSAVFWLPGLAGDFNTQTTEPPGPTSPYGTATTCANPN